MIRKHTTRIVSSSHSLPLVSTPTTVVASCPAGIQQVDGRRCRRHHHLCTLLVVPQQPPQPQPHGWMISQPPRRYFGSEAATETIKGMSSNDSTTTTTTTTTTAISTTEEEEEAAVPPGWELIHSPPIKGKYPRGSLLGKVVSDKMQKTVNVAVDRFRIVPKYRKRMKYTRKFMAHDEEEICDMGDLVLIAPGRRRSKMKHFELLDIIKKKPQL